MTTDHEQAGDCPDDYVEEEETDAEVCNQVLPGFPNMLTAFHNLQHTEMMANLPAVVKRRIKALKKIQFDLTKLEAQFFTEVHALECKYHKLHVPLFEKRETIVNGAYEPTEDESQWPSDDEDELSGDLKDKVKIEEPKDVKGIPDFWLTIFKNVSILSEMVQPHDEPILKHLKDIKLSVMNDPMGFTLDFHFEPNEYFTDAVLKKEYKMKCVPEEDDPFNFEGPEIYKCSGCTINWNKGKNVTVKTVRKKQKHKSRGVVRTVTKTVPNDSFFNFFAPPAIPEDTKEEDVDEELRNLLTSDFEIGHYIRERIVPRAVLYFTGEGIEDEEDFEDGEDSDEEEEEEEADSDKETARNPKDQNCKQQ